METALNYALLSLAILLTLGLLSVFARTALEDRWRNRNFQAGIIWVGGTVGAIIFLLLFVATLGKMIEIFAFNEEDVDYRWVPLLLLGIVGAPFVIWRSIIAQRQADTAEQGYITDRINKAVEGLGAEKTVIVTTFDETHSAGKIERTVPNREVRIGALYSLERIAKDSPEDHITIMKIICAYIRGNAGPLSDETSRDIPVPTAQTAEPVDTSAYQAAADKFREAWRDRCETWTQPDDIRVALEVLSDRLPHQRKLERRANSDAPHDIADFEGRAGHALRLALAEAESGVGNSVSRIVGLWLGELERSRRYRLDFRKADLRGADLSDLQLELANFTEANLQGATLRNARLEGANLSHAHLSGARLDDASLQGANLFSARLDGAILERARLQGAVLINARLHLARLVAVQFHGAQLTEAQFLGASLFGAELQGANFERADLRGASLILAKLQAAIFSEVDLESTDLRSCRMDFTRFRSTDFSRATKFDPESLQTSYGVCSGAGLCVLPEHAVYPSHWHVAADADEDSWDLQVAFNQAYDEWIAAGAPKSLRTD